jgi:NADPH-dependent curcumin reductase CurA
VRWAARESRGLKSARRSLSGKPLGSWPEADTFVPREGPTPEPGPGQALTRTLYISLDPYQWGYKKRGVEPPGAPCTTPTAGPSTA